MCVLQKRYTSHEICSVHCDVMRMKFVQILRNVHMLVILVYEADQCVYYRKGIQAMKYVLYIVM